MEKHKDIRKIVLIITQACNLRCEYCYEQHKSPKKMSFELAKSIIDKEIGKYGDTHFLTIEFFGGEPFLNFELIKEVVDYVLTEYKMYKVKFCATTNGTVFTDEIKSWLTEHKDLFECALSLDGTENMHNMNRKYVNGKGSYKDIDLDFFLANSTERRAKMTVSRATMPYLFEGVKHIQSLGFLPVVDLESNEGYWKMEDIEELKRQLALLIDYFSENDSLEMCRLINYDLMRVLIDKDEAFQYCGAGKNMVTYDVDGHWYPCMALAPVSQGKDAERFKAEDFKSFKLRDDNTCKDCGLLRLCRNCYAVNYNETGDLQGQTPIQCLINRLTISASAKIQYNRISKKYQENDGKLSEEESFILQSILKIQDIIKKEDSFI